MKPLSFLSRPASQLTVWFWVATPVLGFLAGLCFLVGMPFARDRSGQRLPALVWLAGLCGLYAAYMILRGLLAPGPLDLGDLLGDILPLALTTGIAAYAIKGPSPIKLPSLFKAMTVMLYIVFGASLLEAWLLGLSRPDLFLNSSLNLAPILLVPGILVTDHRLAPSRLWVWAGLGAFVLTTVGLGAIYQTRGPFLIFGCLLVLRLLSVFSQPDPWTHRLKHITILVILYLLSIAAIAVQGNALQRYFVMSAFAEPIVPWVGADQGSYSLFERSSMVQAGWAAGWDAPVFGHGPQNRFEAVRPYLPTEFVKTYTHLHNDFITHFVAGGFVAVAFLTALLAFPLILARRYTTQRSFRFEIGLIFTLAFTGTALFNNVLLVPVWGYLLGLSLVASVLIMDAAGEADTKPS